MKDKVMFCKSGKALHLTNGFTVFKAEAQSSSVYKWEISKVINYRVDLIVALFLSYILRSFLISVMGCDICYPKFKAMMKERLVFLRELVDLYSVHVSTVKDLMILYVWSYHAKLT